MAGLRVQWHASLSELPQEQWQGLLRASAPAEADPVPPFFHWSWLQRLETSGSVSPRQGWQPLHLALWRGGTLVAVAPLYLKGHSYGEFVFDQAFAQLAGQLGLRYYPKLLGMSPLSPVQGYRFFVAAQEDAAALTALLLDEIDAFCRRNGILSCNFLYVDPGWQVLAEAAGCARWIHQQSQWHNPGHADFESYLASFNANQRRNIRRERRAVAAAGISVTAVVGEEIQAGLLGRMHHFYEQHCARWGPWGSKYLSEDFFAAPADALSRHLVLFSAHRGDPLDPVAMSLCVRGEQALWGRYWGSDVDLDNLHFEVCYYAPIEWAISQGLRRFDPGAGGSHKRRRGFLAEPRVSLHRWSDPGFDAILRDWLPGANRQVLAEIEAINAELPFHAAYDPPHARHRPQQPTASAG